MATLNEMERAAKALADARANLADLVGEMNTAIEAIKRQKMASLKARVARVAEQQAALAALIEQSPEAFVKPRTVVFHGVKFGYQKGRGGIEFDDAGRLIERIKAKLPDMAEQLINVKETPNKTGLGTLTAAQLRSVGACLVEAGDQVFIQFADTAVDKLVDALIKGATEDAQ